MHSIMKSFCMFVVLASYLVYGQMNSKNQNFRQYVMPNRPVCANIGEYCQTASECCSQTCLSFSYRCVRGAPSISVDKVPLLINNLLVGFNRQCASIGQYCQMSQECCSGSCLSFSYRCVRSTLSFQYQNDQPQVVDSHQPKSIVSIGALCQAVNKQCNSTVSCCPFLACSRTNNTCITDNTGFVIGTESLGETLENRFGEEVQVPVILPTTPCLELGAKCYQHEECCSLRCHGFLHQCVT